MGDAIARYEATCTSLRACSSSALSLHSLRASVPLILHQQFKDGDEIFGLATEPENGTEGGERDEMGVVLYPVDRPHHEKAMETVRRALSEKAFAAAWAEGEVLSLDEVVARALGQGVEDKHTGVVAEE